MVIKQVRKYARKPDNITALPILINFDNDPLLPGERRYLPDIPIINSKTIIGITAFSSTLGNISDILAKPQPGINVGVVGIDSYLTLTLCDNDGNELVKNFPYLGLSTSSFNRKFLPCLLNINTRKSYFKLNNNTPVVPAQITANLTFYLRD